jgi:hypothetical protein
MPPYMTKPITSARGRGRGTEAETQQWACQPECKSDSEGAAGAALGTVARRDGCVHPHWHWHAARPTESLLVLRTATVGSVPPSLSLPLPSLSLMCKQELCPASTWQYHRM